jgi:hypothetical protein
VRIELTKTRLQIGAITTLVTVAIHNLTQDSGNVGSVGLEPTMPEGGRFTVFCNSRYANYPKVAPWVRLERTVLSREVNSFLALPIRLPRNLN